MSLSDDGTKPCIADAKSACETDTRRPSSDAADPGIEETEQHDRLLPTDGSGLTFGTLDRDRRLRHQTPNVLEGIAQSATG